MECFRQLVMNAADLPIVTPSWPIQFWTDCSFSTSDEVLLHPHTKLTKLYFELILTFALNSVFNPSLLPHSPYVTTVYPLPIVFHTKPSRYTSQQYAWYI